MVEPIAYGVCLVFGFWVSVATHLSVGLSQLRQGPPRRGTQMVVHAQENLLGFANRLGAYVHHGLV